MKILYVASFSALAVLAGCASGPRPGTYECELHDTAAAKCASVSAALRASQGMSKADAPRVQSVFEARGVAAETRAALPAVGGQPSGYPEVGEAGMPVFKQPRVLRVWVAPYVDANGNLRSGEYTYFSTPGQWNYGELQKSGTAAAGMFAPSRAENLGFTATNAVPKAAPPKPADALTVNPLGTSAASKAGATPAAKAEASAPAITQPYQRIVGN